MAALSPNNPFDAENPATISERSYWSLAAIHLTDLNTGESKQSLFLPAQLEEALEVEYDRLAIPGLSHRPLQYKGTGNQSYPLDLYWRVGYRADQNDLDSFRKFLLSLCYPTEKSDSILTGAPPRVLFVWPGMISMTCKITAVSIRHSAFAQLGPTTQYVARVTLEEILDKRLLSEDVRLFGMQRGRREDYPEDIRGLEWYSEEEVPATGSDEEAG